ncbi:hypothetical protein ACI2IP_05050 [Microbacterium sp. NPDC090218]
MQWGWNPDTIAAITTALAAIAAMVAGYFAWGAYKLERAREKRVSENLKRQQAEMVSAWTVVRQGPDGESHIELHVQNLASAPVYEVRLGVEIGTTCVYGGWARVLPPSARDPLLVRVADRGLESWRDWVRGRATKTAPYVEITFCDTAGTWWLRETGGALREIDPSEKYRYGGPKVSASAH